MGFSYVVAVAVLLSSSLIFFGLIYSDYVHAEADINSAQQGFNTRSYDLINSGINVTGYYHRISGTGVNVTLNLTNTGSVTLDLGNSTLLVNGTISSFSYAGQYLFPLKSGNLTFKTTSGLHSVEIVFNTGYQKYTEVSV